VKLSLFIILGLLSTFVTGQVPTSLSIGPYSGVERIHLNPALGISSDYHWDATIGAHLFAQTDYSFVRDASLLNLIGQLNNATVIDAQNLIPEQRNSPLILFDLDGGKKELFLRGKVIGPSFTISLNPSTRVGLFSSFRSNISSSDIPENFGIYELNLSYSTNIIDIDPGSISGASWLEVGAHFSKSIGTSSFGFNIKILRGYEGGYIESNLDDSYQFVDSVVTVNNIPLFETAFTNSSINSGSFLPDVNGSGIGIDIGVSHQSEGLSLGASILDIGVLQFKSNLEIYTQDVLANITQIRTQDFRGFTSVRSLIDQLQRDLDITPDVFGVFSVGLPTRVSLYGDYQYDQNISISANLNQRLPIFPHSLKSNNTLVITPRYETSLFSFFLPITVYEYKSVRVGTAFRVGPLTIGSDHISSVLIPTDFRGSDIFLTLNIYPFGNKRDGSGSGGRGRDPMCPKF